MRISESIHCSTTKAILYGPRLNIFDEEGSYNGENSEK